MFTGIIEEIGKIASITASKIIVESEKILAGTNIGDSISVNGVCLTVTKIGKSSFDADVSQETFRVTALRNLKSGDSVNLERAMPADGRFGGHIVTGHIDGIARVISINKKNEFYDLVIELDETQAQYTVKKGSIAINGISLTVADINKRIIKIAVIPFTFENTVLNKLSSGDYVNIETDILSKYVEKFLSTRDNKTEINMDFLIKNGF